MRLWLALIAGVLAGPTHVQTWATREVCLLDEARVHPEIFTPAFYANLQTRSAEIPNSVGRFWRITSVDGAVSHIWGTMHSSLPMILRLPNQVTDTIKAARIVATEVDYTQQTREELSASYTSSDRYRDGTEICVRDVALPSQLLIWIEERLIGLGWGDEALDYLSPAALAELILADPCGDFAAGIYPIQDDRIQMLGAIHGSKILSLEAPRALFQKLGDDGNKGLTRAMIAVYANYLNPAITQEMRSTSHALYLQGRIGEMMAWDELYFSEAYPEEGSDWLARTNDYLLRERNEVFLGSAMADLLEGGVFMAVGTYHLPQEYGLIALLRKAGFAVERIALEGEARP
ncbi:MAG: TraB/GumN family protein [Pseudomonadota bacterium]